ncbi:MAG: GtrA-like protein [Thermoplasmata archaeon]|jgi:putative flippase GtrA|nr:GtrA-like protein [Thermoplasmata archaeon]MEA3167018.1 GtrA-like protein [Thermoplasmata archaeon]
MASGHDVAPLRRSGLRSFLADHGWKTGLFLAVGATAAAVNFLLFVFFEGRLAVEPHLASALATELSILWGFMGHSLVTFRSLERRRPGHHRFLLFHAVALVGLGITVLAFSFWHDVLGLRPALSQLLALPVSTPANYLGQRYLTWKDQLRIQRKPPAPR